MNDERPIEKLLRRYAKKRSDEAGPPPELHPATRRLLQGEVARQFPKPAPGSRPAPTTNFFSLLTRRWIYAVGIFVVLGMAAAMLLPALNRSRSGTMLAQKSLSEERVSRESVAPAAAPALAPATPPAETQPTLAVAEDRRNQPTAKPGGSVNNLRLRDESTTLNYSVTNGGPVGSFSRFADARTDTDALRKADEVRQVSSSLSLDSAAPKTRALAIQPPARATGESRPVDSLALAQSVKAGRSDTGVTADGLSERRLTTIPSPVTVTAAAVPGSLSDKSLVARSGGEEKDAEHAYSQTFANVLPEQLPARAAKIKTETPVVPVLANFKVEQSGNELRVIDRDGSTYLGELNAAPAKFSGGGGVAGKEQATTDFKNADQLATQTPSSAAPFVKQQALNYQWRVEGTNRTLNQNVVFTWNFVETNSLAASQSPASSTQLPVPFPTQLQNSLIYGRAQLGVSREIEVNAVPVKP